MSGSNFALNTSIEDLSPPTPNPSSCTISCNNLPTLPRDFTMVSESSGVFLHTAFNPPSVTRSTSATVRKCERLTGLKTYAQAHYGFCMEQLLIAEDSTLWQCKQLIVLARMKRPGILYDEDCLD